MDRSKIEARAQAWVDGNRDPLIAEMPTLKPSEAIEINMRIMRLVAFEEDAKPADLAAFRKSLAAKGY